jgi:uncharacterized repeat protein (TIGR03803 family)
MATALRRSAMLVAAALVGCSAAQHSALAPLPNAAASSTVARTESVIYSFTGGNDGGDPAADLVFGPSGKLYGTTVIGGKSACGTVFALTASSEWHESAVYSFTCYSDGKNPYGGVVFDSHGTAYGTTVSGGSGPSCGSTGCGVAFELRGSSETVLHDFTGGDDGFGPGNGLAVDEYGNLFGSTPDGGADSQGVVYELSKSAGKWRERVIHTFTGGEDGGVGSLGRLIVDNTDTIYGVAETGGAHGFGTVFRLVPTAKGRWKFSTLYAFQGTPDCASPYGGLLEDSVGNLRGTTYSGGRNAMGCVFELRAKRRYAERILYSFKGGSDGSYPTSTLVPYGRSGFVGTTSMGGGSCDCGTVFTLEPGRERILHAFTGGADGAYPYYGLTRSTTGNIYGATSFYGTTAAGGTYNQGTVYVAGP